ncbi:class I SAM-dependent methyltransferase [Pseudonocardia sp. HH130630-07]|uniref:class I SAM-dependent methyltransferase n=1 Tax=Pseudonocardia sp. HH130630-07 TaxID=1690815 RepID=UPI0008153CF5|nr:class I SAM-dependent methyltransferase [Pseudonocardia sp. HH130630-07]ANY08279.1 methyltransferase type 11 [Pseudonocardia sp. HH130630-07]
MRSFAGFGGQRRPGPAIPSPNIWNWPEVYETENRAQDADGALWAALREQTGDWDGADVVDIGCGDGFHLPHFAERARSVVGVEPHPPLVERARRRCAGDDRISVVAAGAERLPLPDGSADLVHARTAYFFGPGCEPGLAEAERVLRPGGVLAVVDLDFTARPYGTWLRADLPRYDPPAVDRFFAAHGFTLRRVRSTWRFAERADLEEVLRIEFSARTARRAIDDVAGLTVPVGYRLHTRTRAAGLVLP